MVIQMLHMGVLHIQTYTFNGTHKCHTHTHDIDATFEDNTHTRVLHTI
jgi:hypothetical protein